MSNEKSTIGITLGIVLGAATGILLALLLTPKPGRQIRELIRNQVTEIPSTIKEQTADREKVYKETWEACKGESKIGPNYFK